VDDELGERGVEPVVGERQALGGRPLDGNAGKTAPDRLDKALRRIDGGDMVGS
jgi:hypothetical protein